MRGGWNRGLTKETDERVARNGLAVRGKSGCRPAWNKGLTGETDPRVAKYAKSIKQGYNNGRIAFFKDKTKETDGVAAKISRKMKLFLKDKDIKRQYTIRVRSFVKPNKSELRVLAILNDLFHNEWIYTGSGSNPNVIGNKVPDFTNIKYPLLIEFFGTYWHPNLDDEPLTIEYFREYGHECLVIWEWELKDEEKLKDRIISWYYAFVKERQVRKAIGKIKW